MMLNARKWIHENPWLVALLPAWANLTIAFLAVTNRLMYPHASSSPLLMDIAMSWVWPLFNGIAAILIGVSMFRPGLLVTALGFSSGVLAAWAILTGLWGLSAVEPVSLAGPCLGMVCAAGTYAFAMMFAGGDLPLPKV